MTLEAALALAIACHSPVLTRDLIPIAVGLAQHENPKLDPRAIGYNTNRTIDVGLAQINTSNFGWLGLTMETAMQPCASLVAGIKVLFARYNGNPPGPVKAAYAAGAIRRIAAIDQSSAPATIPLEPKKDAPLPDSGVHDAVHVHGSLPTVRNP